MKKFLLILGLVLLFGTNASAEEPEKYNREKIIQQEFEKYKNDCYEKEAYPGGLEKYSMYNDEMKEGDYRYHQCLKRIIIEKIKENIEEEYAKQMITDLDKIEEGILEFYWTLYNRKDNGVSGRMQNDAVLGRRYEDVLEDILYYPALYEPY